MKIRKITHQNRRDFSAILVCQHCEAEQLLASGYDDRYFHDEVIPTIVCEACGKSGGKPDRHETKYPAGMVV